MNIEIDVIKSGCLDKAIKLVQMEIDRGLIITKGECIKLVIQYAKEMADFEQEGLPG